MAIVIQSLLSPFRLQSIELCIKIKPELHRFISMVTVLALSYLSALFIFSLPIPVFMTVIQPKFATNPNIFHTSYS